MPSPEVHFTYDSNISLFDSIEELIPSVNESNAVFRAAVLVNTFTIAFVPCAI
nr:MAG TPA: hypothetical protein [Caudoviricetes sp.]DAR07825.1 MAG TPA: hypothetical protein [Caudoviricetes sp.]